MTKKIRINSGFITNSSSVVYHFPKELWEHPEIQALAKSYGVAESGYLGHNMGWRDQCETIAVTPEEKEALARQFQEDMESVYAPEIDPNHTGPILVYGDEYEGLPQIIISLARTLHYKDPSVPYIGGASYN